MYRQTFQEQVKLSEVGNANEVQVQQLYILTVSHAFNLQHHLHSRPETKTFPHDLSCETRPQIMTMSFFGKLKNLHSGPPAPPRRTDNNPGFGWPQDEFDDEEGDMYEVPPCERPAVKVPQRQVEENIYLERTPSPAVPQRQAAPPPRPSKASVTTAQCPGQNPLQCDDFYYDPNTKKPPEIDRNDKPGRKEMMPPPVIRPAPVPIPAAIEEDVYLDPNEEQEDSDDLYLEPSAACPPAPRGPMRMPLSPKIPLVPASIPMMKPPVPRAKSNSVLPSLNEIKTVPPVEERRATFPTKLPPPTPSVKPPLPAILKEAKPRQAVSNTMRMASPQKPPMTEPKPVASFGGMRPTKQYGNEDKEWFAGDCSRKPAEELLMRINKDGAFLIRHSSAQSTRQPFTLAVLYQQKVYNIPIRYLEDTHSYALGKEGKKNEEIFTSLDEMISYHKNNQLLLIDSKSQAKHTVNLTHPVRP
ncbi:SH2 domain-containing protein 6 [Acanthochromis polyacanthus]|uniref:SH2 domain-containing protein 6 n=1 Tax=Acanthochromis polyacanthus TaxID=80966 RepID=UPI0022347C6A|nr:SH2 domain-containing protein 6 [Acanthochromis polyacanthus]